MAKQPIEFGGEERFKASPEQLYRLLTDLDVMATVIPDLVSSERLDDTTLKCVIKPGFSFLRGTLRMSLQLVECQPSEHATMQVEAQGIGVGMNIMSTLRIVPDGTGSELFWNAQIQQVKGLISAVSPGLIQGAADQVIRHAWRSVRQQLGEA